MQPKFWMILEYKNSDDQRDLTSAYVEEFDDQVSLNQRMVTLETDNLVSIEIISGFSLSKRVQ